MKFSRKLFKMDVKWLLSDGTIEKIRDKDKSINLSRYETFRNVFGEENLGVLNISSLKDEINGKTKSGVYKLDGSLEPYLSNETGVNSSLFLAGGFNFKGQNIITRNGLEEIVDYLYEGEKQGEIGSLVNSRYSTLFEDKISFVELYENSFPVPKTAHFSNFEDFLHYLREEGSQVAKHRFGYDGLENFFVDKNNYGFMYDRDISDYIVQEPLEIQSESRNIMYRNEILASRIIYDRTAPWDQDEDREHVVSSYSPGSEEAEISKKIFNYADATIGSVDIANLKGGEKKVLEFNGVATGYGHPEGPYDLNERLAKNLKRDFVKK